MKDVYIVIGLSQTEKPFWFNLNLETNSIPSREKSEIFSKNLLCKYQGMSTLLNKEVVFWEIPGFNDSKITLTNDQIKYIISQVLIESLELKDYFKGFLIFESLIDSSFKLPLIIEKLYNIAGPECNSSTIIIVNKYDMIEIYKEKIEKIESFCGNNQIKCINWSNQLNNITQELTNEELANLTEEMNRIIPYNGSLLQEIDNQIIIKATELFNSQKIYTEADIEKEAKRIAITEPKIPVIKTKTKTKHKKVWYEDQSSGYFKGFSFGAFKKPPPKAVFRTDPYTITTTYTVYETPDYHNFLEQAREKCKKKEINSFIPEATSFIANSIRQIVSSLWLNDFKNYQLKIWFYYQH